MKSWASLTLTAAASSCGITYLSLFFFWSMQMVKIAWDREDWEFIAVEATVLELFPCSRQDTVSCAWATLFSVSPIIYTQEESIIYSLLLLHPWLSTSGKLSPALANREVKSVYTQPHKHQSHFTEELHRCSLAVTVSSTRSHKILTDQSARCPVCLPAGYDNQQPPHHYRQTTWTKHNWWT